MSKSTRAGTRSNSLFAYALSEGWSHAGKQVVAEDYRLRHSAGGGFPVAGVGGLGLHGALTDINAEPHALVGGWGMNILRVRRDYMSAIRPVILLGAVLALTTTNVRADDAAEGRDLAQEWCVRCHNIEPDGPFKQNPPSFASIAMYRSAQHIYGRIMFRPLHSNMPELGVLLTPDNVDKIVAYITSLETQ